MGVYKVRKSDYVTGKDQWYFALTLSFFLIPTIVWAVLGLMTSMRGCTCKEPFIKRMWLQWKTFESIVESGPQLILQIYIMALPETSKSTTTNTTGIETITTNTVANTTATTYTEANATTCKYLSLKKIFQDKTVQGRKVRK